MESNDSELGDFDPSAEPEEQTEEELQAPESGAANIKPVPELRERSEHDRQIQPGDTVRDLWGNGWLVVHSKAADSVLEYDRNQPDTKKSLLEYEGSRCMGATEVDTVWNCFYLNSNNTLAGGRSGPYGFPESRICRYAYESTDGFKRGRFQEVIRMQVLEKIATEAQVGNSGFRKNVESLLAEAFGEEAASEAFELAEAGSPTSDGDDEDEEFFPADPVGDQ